MNSQHRSLQVGIGGVQVLGHVIAVLGVIGHYEQDGLLSQLLMFGVDLAPLLNPQVQIIGVALCITHYTKGRPGGNGLVGLKKFKVRGNWDV